MTARTFDRCTWALALATIAALLLLGVARAQADPCEVCMEQHGWGQCPCLPVVPEPGGTIPPVTGIACIPAGAEPNISGCVDKVWLPLVVAAHVEQWPDVGEGER